MRKPDPTGHSTAPPSPNATGTAADHRVRAQCGCNCKYARRNKTETLKSKQTYILLNAKKSKIQVFLNKDNTCLDTQLATYKMNQKIKYYKCNTCRHAYTFTFTESGSQPTRSTAPFSNCSRQLANQAHVQGTLRTNKIISVICTHPAASQTMK